MQPLRWLRPAAHKPRLPDAEVRRLYPRLRWQILEATFIGYATYYIVRNNLPVVTKEMGEALGYSKNQLGDMLAATALAYGVGKFLMGAWSDRSNPRYFMALGLVLTALCNFLFGAGSQYGAHLLLWTLNGLAQGMGWPPCGRSLGHWFSLRERGTVFAVWNIAHNVGGGMAGLIAAYATEVAGWRNAFFVPGLLALACAFYLVWRLRDTPQSEGLPPVEEYRGDQPDPIQRTGERGHSTAILEFAGIFSTLLMGWLSDRLKGRRGMVSLLCMIPVAAAFATILWVPAHMLWLDLVLFGVIGFFVYPPVMLLGVAGLGFTSKKAVGAGAGFIGLFGYLGRAAQGKGLGWIVERWGWDAALWFVLGCALVAILLLALTWNLKPLTATEGTGGNPALPRHR